MRKSAITTAFFWHMLHLLEMLLVWIVTMGFLFSSNVDRQDWLQKSLLESVLSNWAVITSFGFRISLWKKKNKRRDKGLMSVSCQLAVLACSGD